MLGRGPAFIYFPSSMRYAELFGMRREEFDVLVRVRGEMAMHVVDAEFADACTVAPPWWYRVSFYAERGRVWARRPEFFEALRGKLLRVRRRDRGVEYYAVGDGELIPVPVVRLDVEGRQALVVRHASSAAVVDLGRTCRIFAVRRPPRRAELGDLVRTALELARAEEERVFDVARRLRDRRRREARDPREGR